ncbi:hypothetical protein [Salmon gill poxvirus]|nr:hypothetical protein [Salmon gill poxvirus]
MDLNNAHLKYKCLLSSCNNYHIKENSHSAGCETCQKVPDQPKSCHKHRVVVCDKNEMPYSVTHNFSQSNKNGTLYWARDNYVTVTLSDGSSKNVNDFIIQAKLSVSEKPKFGSVESQFELQGRIKILECNPLLVAYINKYNNHKHLNVLGVDSDVMWDNTLSLDKVFYCKDSYMKDAVLYVGNGVGSKKVKFLQDYLMCGKGKNTSNGRCKKFREMKNVTCQMSISPVLLSIGKTKVPDTSPQYVKKACEVSCSKIHFGVNWIRCSDSVTTKTIDENGEEITVETPSLMLEDSSNDSDSDMKADSSKMIRGIPKVKGKTAADKLLSYDSGKEDSDEEVNEESEEEVVVKKKASKKASKTVKKSKKPVIVVESEASSTEEDQDIYDDEDDDDEDLKKPSKVSSVWATVPKKTKKKTKK